MISEYFFLGLLVFIFAPICHWWIELVLKLVELYMEKGRLRWKRS